MLRLRKSSLFVLLLLTTTFSYPIHAQQGTPAGLDEYVNKALREWDVPGVAIAVVKDDRVVLAKGYGVRKLGDPALVNEQTLFAIGSASKAFTAAALAMLVDEGKVRWDDPVTKYLPDFALFDPHVAHEITVRDLLCHRSGLARGDALWYATAYSREEVLRRVRYLKPSWGFRSTFGYQNIMFIAAGQIVQAATGKSWDDFVRERIFTPLGMKTSVTSTNPLRNADNVASPHGKIAGKVQPIPWRNIDNAGPAGSINSSASEMAEWVRLQLKEGKHNDRQLISSGAIKEMHTPQTVIRIEKWLSSPSPVNHSMVPGTHFMNYGLGWFLQDYRGHKVVHHGGAIDGMRAMVGMIPEENLGLVVLTNNQNQSLMVALMFKIFDLYLGGDQRDWSAEMLAGMKALEANETAAQKKAEAERAKGTSTALPLDKYAGTYRNDMYGEAKVTLENGKLVLHMLNDTSDLSHWHYDTFQSASRDTVRGKNLVMFVLDTRGRVDELRVRNLASFTRVAEAASAASASNR